MECTFYVFVLGTNCIGLVKSLLYGCDPHRSRIHKNTLFPWTWGSKCHILNSNKLTPTMSVANPRRFPGLIRSTAPRFPTPQRFWTIFLGLENAYMTHLFFKYILIVLPFPLVGENAKNRRKKKTIFFLVGENTKF